jgi:threonyl-tRNA synthetase
MKVLQLHCTDFFYEIQKETPVAEYPPHPKKEELTDVLACFICFEKIDEGRIDELVSKFSKNIKIDTARIRCSKLLLYPYAHLSQNLGSPREAKKFMNNLKEILENEGFKVHKSPFGWYKAFRIYCKGHPLAEAYREY